MQQIRKNAYAKINAYLEVTARREDGYHTILSHMQAITLNDTLTLVWNEQKDEPLTLRLTVSDASVPCDESNLVCRAVRAFALAAQERGLPFGGALDIRLDKNIPMAAGLAGGSADAAAALHGANELLGNPFTAQELCEIAVKLGADIPFCVRSIEYSAMTARGIGDELTAAPSIPSSAWLVVACHGEGVSTPWAYRKLDEIGLPDEKASERQYAAYLSALEQGDLAALAECAHNCFERGVMPEREAVGALMKQMTDAGAVFARMSGSGPSVAGFFEDERSALACECKLREQGIRAYACQGLKI